MAEALSPTSGDLIRDQDTAAIKHNLMERDKRSNLLGGISKISTFFAGITLTLGMSQLLPAIAAAKGLAAVAAVFTTPTIGLGFITVAAVATIAAVASDYMGSHIWQSAGFDQTDYNAKATAKHLVAALKENNMCLTTEHETNSRADGRKWADVVRQGSQPAISQVQ